MAEDKLDLPDDLLSSKPADHSWTPKVEAPGIDEGAVGLHDETKDQVASESSIPLSPQWLYSKPSETKDVRALTSVSLGNVNDPSQKEGWRLDGTEEKKDWRRITSENEGSRRWREEERETGLLGARRDRRKTDRRADSVSIRETTENRVLPSSDRWHDGSNRNSGHEARRDSKWSSRWGPEDKEKESRSEKRTDVEKEKEDAHNDNPSSIVGNRSTSERESDSRDKWRPRHRMEVHSTGSTPYRAAPGFGLERGRGGSPNLGFAVGRGRSNAIGRASSAGTTAAPQSYKSGNVIGKPNFIIDTFCYPRGKLLDIYRRQKLNSSSAVMPDEMEELPSITQVGSVEPLAFVAPDDEEEAILTDIWKGKITSSGVVYNSFRKGRSSENVSGGGDCEANDGKLGTLPSVLSGETYATFQDAMNNSAYQADGDHSLRNHDIPLNMLNEKEGNKAAVDRVHATVVESDSVWNTEENKTSSFADSQHDIDENGQTANSILLRHFHSGGTESTSDVKSKLPDDSNSLFVLPFSDQDLSSNISHGVRNSEAKELEYMWLEDLYFYYIDPHGETQGPFLGADIILWFEEGYFGTELPVRLADAPEGAPFQSLGEVMPRLKLRTGYASAELEQSGALRGRLDPGLPSAASVPENTDSSSANDLCQPLCEFSSLSAQRAQPIMSEPENPLPLPLPEDQNFHDVVAQDEEIVFPGRPGSGGYPSMQSSGNASNPLTNSNGISSLPNELTEPRLPYQSDNKLHPFGLFWSELEGSQTRKTEPSDIPSSVGRSAPFGGMTDPASVAEKWSDAYYGQDMLSVPNSLQDATAAHHLSLVEQEPNHVDLAEQLMSRQFQHQQQLQQRNLLSSYPHINESLLEPASGLNLIHHQQLANHPVPDVEHLLALQLQQQQLQQRQIQLQQQQQIQLQQQQQFHQQQKLLQERQQLQAQQVLLEQFLHGQIPDPGLPQSHIDPIRGNNVLDQVLLEQQLLHELQQQSHHPQRQFVPSIEQLAQAKFGQTQQHDQQRELFEVLSRAQHGQMQSLEHRILLEQLQARQLSMGVRQRNLEEERHIDSLWPVNENDHLLRSLAGNPRAHASGVGPLDFYQRQQRPPLEEQLCHLERNLSFQDRLRQGLYEPASKPFERSLSLHAGASGMNMDVVNAIAHAHGLDMQELKSRLQSAGQVGPLSSGSHLHNSHQSMVPNQFHVSHLDAIDGHWPENSGPIANDWMESRMQQLQINAERQKRESETRMTAEDTSLWMSDGMNDDKSRQLLMELLHQKSGNQSADSPHMSELSFEKRSPSGIYSGSSSSVHPLTAVSDREASLNNSFAIGSYGSNACESAVIFSAGEQASILGSTEKLPYRSESGAMFEGHPSLLGCTETAQAVLTDSDFIDKSSVNREYLEVEGRKYGSKSQGMTKPVTEIHNGMAEQAWLVTADRGEVLGNPPSRHSSLGVSGFYDDKIAPQNSFLEDITINQVPVPTKGQENILLRRPPVSCASSSQEGMSELVSDTVIRGKNSSGVEGGNQVNQDSEMPSGKKEMRFLRTSSLGDADVAEPSFIDMLKSNAKKTTTSEVHTTAAGSESSDGTQGGRSGKKKGKKGRQIDPALLGFKVTSNRIMMGEIQRIED